MSRTKSSRNTKIGRKVAHTRPITRTSFKVKSSKVKVTRPITADCVCHIFRGEGLQTSNLVHRCNTKTHITYKCHYTSKVKGQGRKVIWSIWLVLAHTLRAKKCQKHYNLPLTSFSVKGSRSRSPGRLTLRPKVRHLPNGKAYEVQTLVHWSSTETRITGKRHGLQVKGQGGDITSCASDKCWPMHKSRTKWSIGLNTEIGRKLLTTPWPITRACFEVKKSKAKISRRINAVTDDVSPTNFKLGRRLEHALSTAMASYKGVWS